MQKDPDRWKKFCVTVVELAGIFLLALQCGIQVFCFLVLADDKEYLLSIWGVPGPLGLFLLMCLFSCMQPDKVWDYQRNEKPHRYVFWLYGVSVFLYIVNFIVIFIVEPVNSFAFFVFLVLLGGGGALPLYVYCAQFLFPPRPRLRFVSSLCIIPVSLLWIWCLVLLAFNRLGS